MVTVKLKGLGSVKGLGETEPTPFSAGAVRLKVTPRVLTERP